MICIFKSIQVKISPFLVIRWIQVHKYMCTFLFDCIHKIHTILVRKMYSMGKLRNIFYSCNQIFFIKSHIYFILTLLRHTSNGC